VGAIGMGASESDWARLVGARIVAELPLTAEGSEKVDACLTPRVIAAFSKAGVNIIAARGRPDSLCAKNWQRVGRSDLYIFRLQK
jgi:hypothetical protein